MRRKEKSELVPVWRKYFVVGSIIMAVSLSFSIIIATYLLVNQEKKFLNSSAEDLMRFAENNLETCFRGYEERVGSRTLAKRLYDQYDNPSAMYQETVTETMNNICRELRHVTGIMYLDKNEWHQSVGMVGGDWNDRLQLIDECRKSDIFMHRKKIWKYTELAGYKRIAFCNDIVYLDDSYNMHYIGTMLVLLDAESIQKEYLTNLNENVVLCFCDKTDKIALSNKTDIIGKSFKEVFDESKYTLSDASSAIEGLTNKICVNVHGVLFGIYRIVIIIIGIMFACLGLMIFIEYHQFKRWGKPIEQICSYIYVNSDGILDFSREYNGDSEALYIKRFIENVIENVRKHIANDYEVQLELKNMTIRAYENQINPHFLFNTLQIIQMLSVIGENKKVEKMLSSLAGIMRFNLGENKSVTVQEEISNLRNYMYILEMRYANKLNYNIFIPERMYDYTCIKFLLQPIIENSVSHGFKGLKDNMNIVVVGYEMNGEVALMVKDNGSGISAERLKELKNRLNQNSFNGKNVPSTQGFGIGLININKRLKLIYGKQYGIDIFSREGVGTQVLLHFPIQRYMQEGDD